MSLLKNLSHQSWLYGGIYIKKIISPCCIIKRMISVREWRKKYNRPKNRLDFMPEWSYLDGRGYGPPSMKQKKRYIRDQILGETVVDRIRELQEAKKF